MNKNYVTMEFDRVLELLSAQAVSGCSKDRALALEPSFVFSEVTSLQSEMAEATEILYKYNLSPIAEFDDCREILEKAGKQFTLTMGELLKTARLMRSARILKSSVEGSGDDIKLLKGYTFRIVTDRGLEDEIGECIASEFEMRDSASDALRTLRRQIASVNNKLKDKLASYTRAGDVSKYLQDNIVTMRNGRFVLPVKSESRSGVPGLLHDRSASGATVFIEPFAVVEMNNELKALELAEAEEVERILTMLSEKVAAFEKPLASAQEICTLLDIVFAKAKFTASIEGISPIVNQTGLVKLIHSRHPLINKKTVVPVSLTVGGDYRILLITGPNTGGKTVSLKTIGLFCLMTYIGLGVPCEKGSEIAVFDGVYCDIGDEQSIQQSLSTFSSHIVNLISITEKITDKSLILCDELGGGTDPVEGAALAIGIVQYIEAFKSVAVITTHYSALKEYAMSVDSIMNAGMKFDENTFRPTYQIMMGLPGVSNALNIAELLGLNSFILDRARASLDGDKVRFETVLAKAQTMMKTAQEEKAETERIKAELIEKKNQLDAERKRIDEKLERINFNAKVEIKRQVTKAVDEADEMIEEMKKRMAEADAKAFLEMRKFRNALSDMQFAAEEDEPRAFLPLPTDEIFVGEKAYVRSLNSVGVIEGGVNKNGEVAIRIGSIKTKVKVSELGRFTEKAEKENRLVVAPKKESKADLTQEIKVLGLTVADAVEVLEPYILSDKYSLIKIIHGKGTGMLGKGIHAYLKLNSRVKSFRYGGYGEGDNGVTIAELK